jgi:hypothetical protein
VNTFEKVGFIGNLGCVGRHTGTHSHSHTQYSLCASTSGAQLAIRCRAHRKFRRARRRRTSLLSLRDVVAGGARDALTLTIAARCGGPPDGSRTLSRLASTSSVPRERSTPLIARDHLRPGLGSVPCAAQSDVSQSDTSPATPAPTTPFARLLPARATFATHGPYTVRAFKTVAQSASRVRVQSLQVTPTEQLELDGTHWALLRCRRSCRADRGRRRRRCNCCHRRRHLR